jgi:N utilization substance protein A
MSDLTSAIKSICDEKGLSYEAVIATIEQALAAAYRKDFGEKNQNIKVEFDPETAKSKVYDIKIVVEDMSEDMASEEISENSIINTDDEDIGEARKFNPRTEIQIKDARLIKKTAKVGDEFKMKLEIPAEYGRMAAQTAKQVIIQRLREAEREMVLDEFKDKEKEVVSGIIQRREGRVVLVDLGKTVGILPAEEQIRGEKYLPGERVKVYIKEVNSSSRGPEIILSRTSEEILRKIFYLEIPEISNGLVELKGVAREAGFRSKVAVAAEAESVDPIGSCVGQKGARIQTIIKELGGEKVDIIEYSDDPKKFIANALSPAKVTDIEVDEDKKKSVVKVSEDQLSLAIGKGGQNARLAAQLTGWKIDIVFNGEIKKKESDNDAPDKEKEEDVVSEEEEDNATDRKIPEIDEEIAGVEKDMSEKKIDADEENIRD